MDNLGTYGYNTGANMDAVREHKWIQYDGTMDSIRGGFWIYL